MGRGLGKGFERCGGRWRGWGRGGVESGKGLGEGVLGLQGQYTGSKRARDTFPSMQEVLTCSLEDGVALRKMTAIVGHLILQVVSQSLTLLTCKATYLSQV